MPLESQIISIPLGGGIDEQTHEKLIQPPKMVRVENAIFDERGALRKRHGYTSLGNQWKKDGGGGSFVNTTMGAPKMLFTLKDGLFLADDDRLLSRQAQASTWNAAGDSEGAIDLFSVERGATVETSQHQFGASAATAGGVTVYAWSTPGIADTDMVVMTVVDATTGAVLVAEKTIVSGSNAFRCIARAVNGKVLIFFTENTSANLKVAIVDPSVPAMFSLVTVVSDVGSAAFFDVDVDPTGNRAIVAYDDNTASQLTVRAVNNAGSSIASTTIAVVGTIESIGVCVDPVQRNVGVMWGTDQATNSVRATILTSAFAVTVSAAIIDAGQATDNWTNITGQFQRDTVGGNYVLSIWYVDPTNSTGIGNVKYSAVDTAGTVTTTAIKWRRSALLSHAFRRGAYVYVAIMSHGSYLGLPAVQYRSLLVRNDSRLVATVSREVGLSQALNRQLGTVEVIDAAFPDRVRLIVSELEGPFWQSTAPWRLAEYVLDWTHRPQSVEVGGCRYIANALPLIFDGSDIVEHNFVFGPELAAASAVPNAGSGAMALGTYSYRVYASRLLASGERLWSPCVAAVTVTLTGSHNEVTLTIPTLTQSFSQGLEFVVFRSAVNPTADATFYRVSSPIPNGVAAANNFIPNVPTAATTTFLDRQADATITSSEPDRFSVAGGELGHVQPPAAKYITAGKNRIFLAGVSDDPSTVWFSKLRFHGEPVEFALTAHEIQVPDEGGPITALAVQAEALVVFKESRIYAVAGDGPDNTGGGQGFSEPRLLPSDCGCINHRSIVTTPIGTLFQSAKGIKLLDLSFAVQDIGGDVDADIGGRDITAATLLEDSHQVRFLVANTSTLLYDYLAGQWATFTNHVGVDATVWNGTYAYLRTDTKTYVESASFTDDGTNFALVAETGWIKLSGLEGYQRVWKAIVTGEYKADHDLRIKVAKDYATSWQFTADWDASVASASEYACRFDWPGMSCKAVRFRFEDISSAAEGYALLTLELEVGIRPGKLSALPTNKFVGAV